MFSSSKNSSRDVTHRDYNYYEEPQIDIMDIKEEVLSPQTSENESSSSDTMPIISDVTSLARPLVIRHFPEFANQSLKFNERTFIPAESNSLIAPTTSSDHTQIFQFVHASHGGSVNKSDTFLKKTKDVPVSGEGHLKTQKPLQSTIVSSSTEIKTEVNGWSSKFKKTAEKVNCATIHQSIDNDEIDIVNTDEEDLDIVTVIPSDFEKIDKLKKNQCNLYLNELKQKEKDINNVGIITGKITTDMVKRKMTSLEDSNEEFVSPKMQHHNVLERKRRRALTTNFSVLKRVLTCTPDGSMPKAAILQLATSTISKLTNKNVDLCQIREDLRQNIISKLDKLKLFGFQIMRSCQSENFLKIEVLKDELPHLSLILPKVVSADVATNWKMKCTCLDGVSECLNCAPPNGSLYLEELDRKSKLNEKELQEELDVKTKYLDGLGVIEKLKWKRLLDP